MLNNSNKFSFIIADDDADDQMLIQEAVKSIDINIECTSVFNGSQLLDLLLRNGAYMYNQCIPDAIILDLNMPVLDGLGALKQIKRNPELREIPVFILYSLRKDDYSTQCRSLGVAGLYAKPHTAEELKNIFREIYRICGGNSQYINYGQTY
ncbi:MAG: response regulator [Bacteroidetes bacterium]|nr:response regulator [Bacteroidota bacterium]